MPVHAGVAYPRKRHPRLKPESDLGSEQGARDGQRRVEPDEVMEDGVLVEQITQVEPVVAQPLGVGVVDLPSYQAVDGVMVGVDAISEQLPA